MNSHVMLSEFLTEYTERNTGNQYRPVAVGRYGIRSRESIYSKELAKDYSKNKVIFQNTLTVGMGSVQIDIGILTENVKYSVSPAYHTYKIAGINPDYLRYCLECRNQDMFERYVKRGSRQGKTIDLGRWLTYEIPVCNEEKQKEIVEKLDFVELLIAARREQLAKLDELVKSRFIELFGDPVINPKSWETAPLSALIINANNGMARRGKDADGSIVLRLVELQNGFIDYSAPNRICLNETEKKRYELVDNDFLFARVNGNPDYVGRCAVFKSIDEPVFHNDHIIRVHFDEAKINGCFMSALLNSDYGKRQMREQIKTSAGQYTISQDGIGAIGAILPPLELQNEFAVFVEQVDKSKLAIQESLAKLETLKKALMQQYFG